MSQHNHKSQTEKFYEKFKASPHKPKFVGTVNLGSDPKRFPASKVEISPNKVPAFEQQILYNDPSPQLSDLHVAKKLLQISESAKSRNLDFDLSLRTVKRLLNTKKCFYSGVELDNTTNSNFQLTFDRVDNNKGYVEGNLVACSKEFNEKKTNLSVVDIKLLYKGLKKKKLVK